jgi:hypothetical protein
MVCGSSKWVWIVPFFFLAASGLRAIAAQQPIETSAGKEFNIILESNPTTDYDWAIVGELD